MIDLHGWKPDGVCNPSVNRCRRTGILLLAGVAFLGCEPLKTAASKSAAAPKAAPLPEVIVTLPTTDYITDYEDFTGRTDAEFTITVRARVQGYLDKVYFKDGEEVNAGDMLFEIDPRPYEAELARMEAALAQSEAHLNRLDADLRRAKNLMARGSIGREEYDKITGDQAEAVAAVGIAKASRDLSKLNVGFTKIKAQIAGRLGRRLVDPGNLVKADDTALTTIVSLDPMFVYFEIDERTMLKFRRLIGEGRIKSRQEGAVFPVHIGLSDEEGFPHEGNINYSDNRVDPNTGTLQVRAAIANPKPRLLSPGLFTRVRVPIGAPHKSILVPEEAIGTDQGQKFVYVVNDKDEVVKRSGIKVGSLNNGMRVVEDGLSPTERVIVSGSQRVRLERDKPAPKVRPVERKPAAPRADVKDKNGSKSVGGPQATKG